MEASDMRATIERLRELEAKATKGEWFAYAGYVCVTEEHRDATGIPIPEPSNFGQWEGSTGDEALIIAARNALPLLLRLASERLDTMESEPRTLEVLDVIQLDCACIMRDTRLASALLGAVLGIQTVAENHARALRISAPEPRA